MGESPTSNTCRAATGELPQDRTTRPYHKTLPHAYNSEKATYWARAQRQTLASHQVVSAIPDHNIQLRDVMGESPTSSTLNSHQIVATETSPSSSSENATYWAKAQRQALVEQQPQRCDHKTIPQDKSMQHFRSTPKKISKPRGSDIPGAGPMFLP
jgi:hypothetical protein